MSFIPLLKDVRLNTHTTCLLHCVLFYLIWFSSKINEKFLKYYSIKD